ncbi:MAG: tRNA (guanosine(46)-N7)-methyltransferase TrmB [Hyphomicrobiales bacterium]|nr:tRNA (guanosine(46)-N7)-methyltransferase TrmB [Hyphomicrobiales bacterium]
MTDDIDTGELELRSFGRRRGRKLSTRQERLLAETLPRVQVALERLHEPGLGFSGVTPREVWLEIGFGGGEHLIAQARRYPDVLVIGCEPFEEGVVKVLSAIEAEGLTNIRVHPDDARDLLRRLPARCIDRAFILFPDPWPKRKHQKRRLVAPPLLTLLARAMRPGARLSVATDIPDYARTMLMAFAASPEFRWTARRPGDWQTRPADRVETRYEHKALAEGRRPTYLEFERL